MDISIRNADRRDIETIVRFNAAMAEETEHRSLDRALLRSGVTGLFDNPSYGFYIVAEAGNDVAGQLMITYEWSDWRNGVIWWIQSVYVAPAFRSRGVFRAMFEHIEQRARSAGNVRCLRLYVEKENKRAQRVYENHGMRATQYDLFETDLTMS